MTAFAVIRFRSVLRLLLTLAVWGAATPGWAQAWQAKVAPKVLTWDGRPWPFFRMRSGFTPATVSLGTWPQTRTTP